MSGYKVAENNQAIIPLQENEIIFILETAPIKPAPKIIKKAVQHPPAQPEQSKKTIKKKTPQKKVRKKGKFVKKNIHQTVKKEKSNSKIIRQNNNIVRQKNKQSPQTSPASVSADAAQAKKTTLRSSQKIFNPKPYIARIKNKIAHHKYYPNSARRRGIEGRVGIELSIAPNGTIQSLHIIKKSGSKILDKAAIKSVRDAAPFEKMAKSMTFNFFMKYNLEDS